MSHRILFSVLLFSLLPLLSFVAYQKGSNRTKWCFVFQAQLNGYNNNGNAVSATANGPSQALINQIQQQPIRLNNSHLNGSTQLNGSGQVNGHHHTQQQHPIRTPVPPAPPMMHQPAQISANVPPPPREWFLCEKDVAICRFSSSTCLEWTYPS